MSAARNLENARTRHVPGVHVDDLIEAARSVGLGVRYCRSERDANIYVWTTNNGAVLYIGKQESVRRLKSEQNLTKNFDASRYRVGFVALVARHQAKPVFLSYDGKLSEPIILDALEEYEGQAFADLSEYVKCGGQWSVKDVELVLIRMMILAGFPVANSQGGGQWESSWGRREDALAAVAVISSSAMSIPTDVKREIVG